MKLRLPSEIIRQDQKRTEQQRRGKIHRDMRALKANIEHTAGKPYVPPRHNRPPAPIVSKTECTDYVTRDRLLRELGWPNYGVYLKSGLWEIVRAQVLRRDNLTCFMCGRRAWMVHHCHYSRAVLLGKNLSPLLSVCGPCHQKIEVTPGGRKRSLDEAANVVGRQLCRADSPPPRAEGGRRRPTTATPNAGNGALSPASALSENRLKSPSQQTPARGCDGAGSTDRTVAAGISLPQNG